MNLKCAGGPAERPNSILDLIDDKWRGRVAIAKPLAGTTATHAACLFVAWGPERAQAFFRQVKQNCRVLAGNRHVARAVAQGQCAFGLTDTDDALAELEAGMPVAIVFPDQTPRNGAPLGALVIPNTVAVVHGAPHRREAEQLVEFLLSPQVEESLAQGPSAQLPLHSRAKASSRVAPNWRPPTDSPSDQQQESAAESTSPDKPLVAMSVDFAAAAQAWDAAAKFLREEFATAE